MNNSRHLRVGYIIQKPYSNPCVECIPKNCECKSPGVEAEIVLTMLKMLNFSFELIHAPENSWGNCKILENKTFDCFGILNLFQKKLIDTAFVTFAMVGNRHKRTESPLEFSFPVSYMDTFFVMSRISKKNSMNFLFFTQKFNFSFFFVIFFTFFSLKFFIFFTKRKSRKFSIFFSNFFKILWKGSLGLILCHFAANFSSDFAVSSFFHLPFQTLHEAMVGMAAGTVKRLTISIPEPCNDSPLCRL